MKSQPNRRHVVVAGLAATLVPQGVAAQQIWDPDDQETTAMRVRFAFGDHVMTATLYNNPPARDLYEMLPLDLTIEDFSSNENIAHLPRKLTEEGAGPFDNERPYDLCYYVPWGNLAMFYADFRHPGLIRLGDSTRAVRPSTSGARSRSGSKQNDGDDVMDIVRAGSTASAVGPKDWFTGVVRIDPLFNRFDAARTQGAQVTFEPGARTAWHTHPLGQILVITSGLGRVQREGGAVEEVRPGDVVWFAPGERHWHGASPSTAMTHIAIHEVLDGKVVDWLEHVADADYRA